MVDSLELVANEEEPGYYIRLCLALSVLSKQPVKITNIRQKPEEFGLTKSDFMYIKIFEQMSCAKTDNVNKNESYFYFDPSGFKCNGQILNISFPGLVSQFLPNIMLVLYNTTHKIRINGPTDKEKKITVDYIKHAIIPLLDKINIKQRIDITKRGYYQDMGSIILQTKETKDVYPIELTKTGEFDRIIAFVHSYGYGDIINKYMLEGAQNRLRQENLKINNVDDYFVENRERFKGYGIDLFAIYENTILGANYTSIKKHATQVGKESADRLLSTIKKGLPLDKHAANIIIPFLCLAKKQSTIIVPKNDIFISIATDLCNKFLGTEFEIEPIEETSVRIKIKPKKQ